MFTNIFESIAVLAAKESGEAVVDRGLGLDWGQLLFYIVCFLIAMVVLNKYLFGPIGDILNAREARLEQSLAKVEELEIKIANADNQAKAIISQASSDGRQIIEDAKAEVEPAKAKVLLEADNNSQEIIANANRDASKIVSTANATAEKEVVDLAQKAITKAFNNLSISDSNQQAILNDIVNNKL